LREKTGAEVVEQKNEEAMEDWEIKNFRKHQRGNCDLKGIIFHGGGISSKGSGCDPPLMH